MLQISVASAADFAADAVASSAGGAQDAVFGLTIERDGSERDNTALHLSIVKATAGNLQLRATMDAPSWPSARIIHPRWFSDFALSSSRDAIRRPPRT